MRTGKSLTVAEGVQRIQTALHAQLAANLQCAQIVRQFIPGEIDTALVQKLLFIFTVGTGAN